MYKLSPSLYKSNDSLSQKLYDKPQSKNNYKLSLGNFTTPLIENNYYDYYAIRFCSMAEIFENLTKRIKLTRDDIPVYEGNILINLFNYSSTDQTNVYYKSIFSSDVRLSLEENTVIPKFYADSILNNIDSLSLLQLSFTGAKLSNTIGTVKLVPFGKDFKLDPKNELVYCYAEKAKYVREVPIDLSQQFVSQSHTTSDIYKFQQLELDGKQFLKLDTTEKSIKTFFNYYRHNPQYQIIHLPGFRTKDRFKKGTDDLYGDSSGNWINLISDPKLDYPHLYEYTTSQDSDIQILIGDINYKDKRSYYQKSWFLNNFQKGLEISVLEGKFKPIYLEVLVSDSTGAKYYRTDNLSNPGFKNLINDFPDLFKVYIQNIIFIDKKGRKTRIVNGYGFSVVK